MKQLIFLAILSLNTILFSQHLEGKYFIAIDIPKQSEIKVTKAKEKLQKYLYGKFEPSEKFHITLKFIGKVQKKHLDTIRKKLKKVTMENKKFMITLENLGFFPNEKKAKVAWIGVQSSEIIKLKKAIDTIFPEKVQFSFTPHVTMARLSYTPPTWLISKIKKQVKSLGTITIFRVSNIYILKSYQGKYTIDSKFSLQ